MQLTFRPLGLDDLDDLRRWLNSPHVYEWWGVTSGPGSLGGPGPDAATAEQVHEKYAPGIASDEATTHRYVIELDGRAVGLIQHYRLADEPAYAAAIGESAPGAAGIDLFVGELDTVGRGVGTAALDAYVRTIVFADPRINRATAGPHPQNARSCRASRRPASSRCATSTWPVRDQNASTYGTDHPMRDPGVVRRGVAACRGVLGDGGILVVQDATLPSVTTLVAGEVVRGSWWSHEQAHSIFDVLEELEADATVAKLVAKKQTLVHRDRWPDLAAVGAERAAWQLDHLTDDAAAVVKQVDAADGALRSDDLVVAGTRAPSTIVREVEVRLLLAVDEVHTETGRHAKMLQRWDGWVAAAGVAAPLPDPGAARALFEAVVRMWAPDRVPKLLPWPMEAPP